VSDFYRRKAPFWQILYNNGPQGSAFSACLLSFTFFFKAVQSTKNNIDKLIYLTKQMLIL